jgi:hypothetical protein
LDLGPRHLSTRLMEVTVLADTIRAEKAMAEHPMYPSRTLAMPGPELQQRVGPQTGR